MALTTGPAGLSMDASGWLMRLTSSASSALRSCTHEAVSTAPVPHCAHASDTAQRIMQLGRILQPFCAERVSMGTERAAA